MKHIIPVQTQDERLTIMKHSLWFSALRYEEKDKKLFAYIDVDETATVVLGILDEMGMLAELPPE